VSQNKEIAGATIFILLDVLFRKAFALKKISFPSQLGGCCIFFAMMVVAEFIFPGSGESIFRALSPGAGLLAKGLPVFFVPGLAMLPLAPSLGSSIEILKVLAVVVVGFFYSLTTTAFSAQVFRKMQGVNVNAVGENIKLEVTGAIKATLKPFSGEIVLFLGKCVILSAAASIGFSRLENQFAAPMRTICMTLVTFFGYIWGARLPSSFTRIVHPLVTSTVITLLFTLLTSILTSSTFNEVLGTYKTGSLSVMSAGAGDILLFLLGPAVISFAIAMYSRKKVMAENLPVILLAVLVGSAGGLFGTAAFARLINIGSSLTRLSVLPRNVTTPLAIAITNIIGGNVSIAVAVVVLTGIFGGTYGAKILSAMGITDPVSRGLAIGASAQGLGVASIANEKEAFPFAAISMVLTAVAGTTLVSIPSVKDALINLALGV